MGLRWFAFVAAAVAVAATAASAVAATPRKGPGWPVAPVNVQHPIRSVFLDPRPDPAGGVFHNGLDISVRDNEPEPGAPAGHTHRVYALTGGTVWTTNDVWSRSCHARVVRVGNFGYGHVDPVGTVFEGQVVRAGDPIGWTCAGQWHVHLSQWRTEHGRQVYVNPLAFAGLRPYRDTAPPRIGGIRFTAPGPVDWLRYGGVLASADVAPRLPPASLQGTVDAAAYVSDRQSFDGWYADVPALRGAAAPYWIHVDVTPPRGTFPLVSRDAFRGDRMSDDRNAFADTYAAGTTQTLPAYACFVEQAPSCSGQYWFHLFGAGGWNTRLVRNGNYRLCVTARDTVGNRARSCVAVSIEN